MSTFGNWENQSQRRYDGRTKWSRRDVNSSVYPLDSKARMQKAVQAIGVWRRALADAHKSELPVFQLYGVKDPKELIIKENFEYLDGLSDQERTRAFDIAG